MSKGEAEETYQQPSPLKEVPSFATDHTVGIEYNICPMCGTVLGLKDEH